MSVKHRVKIGNAMSKVLARLEHSGRKGSVEEAILKGDFFQDDYEKSPELPKDAPRVLRGPGRPRKHPVEEPAKTSSRVPGVNRVGDTLKTRIQVDGRRVQVDLKTNKWEVARKRKGQIDGMLFEGKFFGKCPPITLKDAWDQYKDTQQGQVSSPAAWGSSWVLVPTRFAAPSGSGSTSTVAPSLRMTRRERSAPPFPFRPRS